MPEDGRRFTVTDERGFSLGLTITAVSQLGYDDSSQTLDDNGDLLETQSGQRLFTLQVQALTVANGVNVDWAMAITEDDLVPEEETLVTISRDGYIKRVPIDTYRTQKRGGRGVQAANLSSIHR